MNKIKLENVWKNYGNLTALNDINLEIDKGEIVIVIGPSGSGKTTLLNILGLIDKPTKGRVYLNQKFVGDLSEKEIANIRNREFGFIFQFFYLIPELTVIENVFLPLWIKEKNFDKKFISEAEIYLEKFGILDKKNYYPSKLSGGEMQRVAICRSLICNPEIIFGDEPTGSIDSVSALNFYNFIKRLNKDLGKTFVIATHNENFLQFATKIVYLKEGKIEKIERRG